MLQKKRRVYDRKIVLRRQAQIARCVPPVSREDALLGLEEGDAGFVLWQTGVAAFAERMHSAALANGMLIMEASTLYDMIFEHCSEF
jgi:hypothetical protein